jgi:hypothetical protein
VVTLAAGTELHVTGTGDPIAGSTFIFHGTRRLVVSGQRRALGGGFQISRPDAR